MSTPAPPPGSPPPPWQQPPGPQYGGPQHEPPKKKSWIRRHKILTSLGVVLVLIIIGSVAGGGSGTSSKPTAAVEDSTSTASGVGGDSGTTAAAKPTEAAAPKIGTSVRDGKFEFTVVKVRCGVPNVGGQYGQDAQGQFCLVTLKVANIGDKPQTLDASSQVGYDQAGNKLSADSGAGIYANPSGGGAFLNDINPGNAVSAVVVFDIPKTGKLTKLELHDSPFSGGVDVQLT